MLQIYSKYLYQQILCSTLSDNGAQLIPTQSDKPIQLEDRKSSTGDKDRTKSTDDVEDQFKLKLLPQYEIKDFKVDCDCELKEHVENKLKRVKEFKKGCVFYEFRHDFESISDDQELIFKSNVGVHWL